jgi:hypothetical protein
MKNVLLSFSLLLICGILNGQQNINDYSKICYCSGETPHSILRYDNNWELLWAFKSGLSKKGLDSLHIPYTESQLRLLLIYKLVRLKNEKYYTDIPILDLNQTNLLRTKTIQLAEIIIPSIESDIKSLVSYLKDINYSENQFSILFSYVLDGLVWQKFEVKHMIKPLNLNRSNYPWVGTFWLLTPVRKTFYGTNTESDSSFTIGITSGGPDELMKGIYDEENGLLKVFLKNYIDYGKITDEKVFTAFKNYNLFDEKGNLKIPVIIENNKNMLYNYSDQIAENICIKLVSNDIFKEVIKDFHFQDEEQAIIILYHEVMWDLLSIIEERQLIEEPNIIRNSSQAELRDVSKLLYIVRKN